MAAITASIAICTRDRAESLRATLGALERTSVPDEIRPEVLIVDNGSVDPTADVAAAWAPQGFVVRYVRAACGGVAHARNAALAAATGKIILFLDDDVRPPPQWLPGMCAPILAGRADAVAGGVRLAPHLERPWMERPHRTWLADTGYLDPHAPQEFVSANMAIGRHVLERVPAFDPELGPGALGLGEDALFSWQLLRAGFAIAPALDVAVEHHFDARRLTRRGFRDAAAHRGRTLAYQRHHWEHLEVPEVARRFRRRRLKFALGMVTHPFPPTEGMPIWEMFLREDLAFLRHYRLERTRPRNYERFGLIKHSGAR